MSDPLTGMSDFSHSTGEEESKKADADAEAFDQLLKRFVELMKCLALGVSFTIAGAAVFESGISGVAASVGAIGCTVGGGATLGAAAMIFVKPYMHNIDRTTRAIAKGVLVFIATIFVVVCTFLITMDVIKARRAAATPSGEASTETLQTSDMIVGSIDA